MNGAPRRILSIKTAVGELMADENLPSELI